MKYIIENIRKSAPRLLESWTIAIVLLALLLFAQDALSQSRYLPNGVRVGTNLIPLVSTLTRENIEHYELTGDIDFYKYLLTLDLGRAEMNRVGDNFQFLTGGVYYKAGLDLNFIENVPGRHALGLGLRYAQSRYHNELIRAVTSDIWGDRIVHSENKNITTRWMEGLGIIKVDTWFNIQLGFSLAYKFAKKTRGSGDPTPYDIPGYGLAEAPTLWSFNYYLYYYIPFRKEAPATTK